MKPEELFFSALAKDPSLLQKAITGLAGNKAVTEKYDHGCSEVRQSSVGWEGEGYTFTLKLTARIEVNRPERISR